MMLLVSGTSGLMLLFVLWTALGVQAGSEQQMLLTPTVDDLSTVNQIGGGVYVVDKQGIYAYVGMGPRLLVMDVQDQSQPVVLGQTKILSGVVSRLEVADNFAYVGVSGGLSIVDLTNPTAPTQVSFYDTPGTVFGIVVSGTLAYVAESPIWDGLQYVGGGLRILNVVDPANPWQIGYFPTNESSASVAVLGNYAYLNNNSGVPGIIVLDVSDPVNPTQVNFVDTFSSPQGTAIHGGYLYVTVGASGLLIFSLANAGSPTSVGYYDALSNAQTIFIQNGRAYIANQTTMVILSLADPIAPTLLGNYIPAEWPVMQAMADGDVAYVANSQGGLRVVDVTNAATPVEVGVHDLFGGPYGIEVENGFAYMLDYLEGLHVLDLTDGSTPTVVGFYGPQYANDFKVRGDVAYLVDDTNLIILDVTDSTAPTLTVQHPVSLSAQTLDVDGNYAYIAASENGLRVVDVSNPQAPLNVGELVFPSAVGHVAVANGFAYVADQFANNVYIVDVSNPVTPTLMATYPLMDKAYGLDVAGNYLYVAQNGLGLHVIDVTTPTMPIQAGQYPLGWYSDKGDVVVANGRVYLTSSTNGVALFDVTDPTTPVLVDDYDSAGFAESVAVAIDYLYVADNAGGLLIFGEDGLPRISVNDEQVLEGNAGTAVLTFTVSLNSSAPITQETTVDYATANGTAVNHQDYHPISGTLTFAPGENSQIVSVLVVGDTAVEANETLFLQLSNPTNAILLHHQATGTILNDDEEVDTDHLIYLPVLLKP
jgi:hypothetical protein